MKSLRFSKGSTGPALADVIKIEGLAMDLSGATVRFKMRPVAVEEPVVNSLAEVTSAANGEVKYEWRAGDLSKEGSFAAWWNIEKAGKTFDTDEFSIFVDAHAPGSAVTTGLIAKRVRAHMPVTYAALVNDANIGESMIQDTIDIVKTLYYATNVDPSLEATNYGSIVCDYLAKVTAINIIPSAIDYWLDRPVTISLSGTNESMTKPDRIEGLWKLHEKLLRDVKEEAYLAPPITKGKSAIPGIVNGGNFVTIDPQKIGKREGEQLGLPFEVTEWGERVG